MSNGEGKMLFDLRGGRKHVVRVVYAILALLMALSLLLVVGPFSIGELVGGGGGSSASGVLDDQAESIEAKLAKEPDNEALLLALTRTRINAGNALIEFDAAGARNVTDEALAEFELAKTAWNRYLRQQPAEVNPNVALLVANAFISLAEASTTEESVANMRKAAEAQRFVAEARPIANSLTTLAYYEYAAGNFKAGDQAAKQAEGLATSKTQKKEVKDLLSAERKRLKKFHKQLQAFAKAQQGQRKEALENPFSGLGGAP